LARLEAALALGQPLLEPQLRVSNTGATRDEIEG
jgi:hypothetical protein